MKDKPKITIVTVCYNAAETIENTILSVLSQTYDNIEYIIVDGASLDGTIDIVKKYQNRISQWISEPDTGIYDAMNKSIKMAHGIYILFLGADDTFCSDNVIGDFVDKTNYQKGHIYYGNVVFNSGKIYWGKFNKWKWAVSNICHQSIFYPQDVYQSFEYDISYRVFADYVYNLTLLNKGYSFDFVPLNIANYRLDGFSSKVKDVRFDKEKHHLIIKTVGFLPLCYGIVYRALLHVKQFFIY